jgi:hypothetical protein
MDVKPLWSFQRPRTLIVALAEEGEPIEILDSARVFPAGKSPRPRARLREDVRLGSHAAGVAASVPAGDDPPGLVGQRQRFGLREDPYGS